MHLVRLILVQKGLQFSLIPSREKKWYSSMLTALLHAFDLWAGAMDNKDLVVSSNQNSSNTGDGISNRIMCNSIDNHLSVSNIQATLSLHIAFNKVKQNGIVDDLYHVGPT